jgi:hypothetical protein
MRRVNTDGAQRDGNHLCQRDGGLGHLPFDIITEGLLSVDLSFNAITSLVG